MIYSGQAAIDYLAVEVMRKNVRAIRPGLGLPQNYLEQVLGKDREAECESGARVGLASC